MTTLSKIEPLLTNLTTQDFDQLQQLIKQQISSNRLVFDQAINSGDINLLSEYGQKVSFDLGYLQHLKKDIVPHIHSLNYLGKNILENKNYSLEDGDTMEIFHTLFKNILQLEYSYNDFRKKIRVENTKFLLSDVLFASLTYRLKVNFQYSGENPSSSYFFLKPLLKNNVEYFNQTLKHFCDYSLSKIDYQENSLLIKELLDLGLKTSLFEQAKKLDNYNYLKSIIPTNEIFNDELMITGLTKYHFPLVKECFEYGVPFFKSDPNLPREKNILYKNAFSAVFSSKDSLELQEYIIEKIPDISVGAHIIAKTILHKLEENLESNVERNKTRMTFIDSIFLRYRELSEDNILEFKAILDKRVPSMAKDILIKSMNFHLFDKKFPILNYEIKKNKI